jgi:aminoglycoside phosphotransferase (APT) family kinase protein
MGPDPTLADELLVHLRAELGPGVEYDEPPARLGGGYFTANHRFSVRGGPPAFTGAMVLRLFPHHAVDGLDAWEAAVQTFVHERGIPAPAVTLRRPGTTIEGRRWFVMELLPGRPMIDGIEARRIVPNIRRLMGELPRITADAHLALHRLDPAPLAATFGAMATIERWWRIVEADEPHPLRPGVDWLRDNLPEPRSAPVLCHGDSWGGNLLVDDGRLTGFIDWTVATVAEPALDVGFLTMALSLAPVPMPRPVQRILQRIGRRLAASYREAYEAGSGADLTAVPYYEALRCLTELIGVVRYRTTIAGGRAYDSPRPTWDMIADQMLDYFERRTDVRLQLPPPA